MTIAELDDVDYDLEVDGEQVRRQLARRVFEARGWATVAVAYRERDAGGAWKPAKVALLRFRRTHDAWKKHASITLAFADACALAELIAGWANDPAFATSDGDGDGDSDEHELSDGS